MRARWVSDRRPGLSSQCSLDHLQQVSRSGAFRCVPGVAVLKDAGEHPRQVGLDVLPFDEPEVVEIVSCRLPLVAEIGPQIQLRLMLPFERSADTGHDSSSWHLQTP